MVSLRVTVLAVGTLVGAFVPARANAQDDPAQRGTGSVVALPSRDSIAVTLSGYVQVDGRWLAGVTQQLPDGFVLRRARFVVDAVMPTGWHMRLQSDFGQGRVQAQDAFVGYEGGRLQIRAGRFRPYYGLERTYSSSTLLFPERSLVNSLVPSRKFGTQLRWTTGAWGFALGGFRSPIGTDVGAIDTDGDVEATIGSGHDLLLRAGWAWRREQRYADVQASLLEGRERGSLESPAMTRILTVGQQPIAVFRHDGTPTGTVIASGSRRRASVGAIVGNERTMVSAEGTVLTQHGTLGDNGGSVTTMAHVLRMSHVWNGRRLASQEIVPASSRGATEVGLRFSVLGNWGGAVDRLLSSRSERRATSAGAAVGWMPGPLTRVTLAYDITATRRLWRIHEHALMARIQQSF